MQKSSHLCNCVTSADRFWATCAPFLRGVTSLVLNIDLFTYTPFKSHEYETWFVYEVNILK